MEWSPDEKRFGIVQPHPNPTGQSTLPGVAVHVLDLTTGTVHANLSASEDPINPLSMSLAFSPNGRFVATSVITNGNVRIFDLTTGKRIFHRIVTAGYHLNYTPDSSRLIVNSAFCETIVVGLPQGRVHNARRPPGWGVASAGVVIGVSPLSDAFALRCFDVELFSAKTGAKLGVLPDQLDSDQAILGFSDDGSTIVGTLPTGLVMTMPVKDLKNAQTLRKDTPDYAESTIQVHGNWVYRNVKGGLEILNFASGSSRVLPARPTGSLLFSPSGQVAIREVSKGIPPPDTPAELMTLVLYLQENREGELFDGQPRGFTSTGDIVYTQGDVYIRAPGAQAPAHAVQLDTYDNSELSPSGRFMAFYDGQLAFVRLADKAVLRVDLTEENNALKVSPTPDQIAAFFK